MWWSAAIIAWMSQATSVSHGWFWERVGELLNAMFLILTTTESPSFRVLLIPYLLFGFFLSGFGKRPLLLVDRVIRRVVITLLWLPGLVVILILEGSALLYILLLEGWVLAGLAAFWVLIFEAPIRWLFRL